MTTTNFSIRLDENLKAEATKILAGYGLSPTQAIKLFLNQIVATKQVPLSFDFQTLAMDKKPSAKVVRAIAELENDDLPTYDSVDDLIRACNEKV